MPKPAARPVARPMGGRPPRRKKTKEDEEAEIAFNAEKMEKMLAVWVPATDGGRAVKSGEVTNLDDYFAKGFKVMEPEIVDSLVHELKDKMLEFKKTARITRQGRNFSYRATILVGDGNAYVGVGTGKDKERFPAIQKATRAAKMNIIRINKGCGSWQCRCNQNHSVPFKVVGKHSSIKLTINPAPKGTGLVVGDGIKDVFKFVGIKDAWGKAKGRTSSTLEFVTAAINALSNTNKVRLSDDMKSKLGEKQ